jgi:hypothetical protein
VLDGETHGTTSPLSFSLLRLTKELMMNFGTKALKLIGVGLAFHCAAAYAVPYAFSTGAPDGRMAAASRPGPAETETADDFVIAQHTNITSATFTGLLTNDVPLSSISDIQVEIYRVFPLDSTVPPSGNVPTRNNSPADVAFDTRALSTAELTFSTSILSTAFTALNSVVNGIHKFPNQTTGGEGVVTGTEVVFTVDFATPFDLAPDHYFFVPQVAVAGGDFLWLSAPRPIVPPGTAFSPDLQSWIRNGDIAPDWLRIGTDIVGGTPAPTFNQAFSLTGETAPVPEPLTAGLVAIGLLALLHRRTRH